MPVQGVELQMTKHPEKKRPTYSLSDLISVPPEFVSHTQPKLEIGEAIYAALKEQEFSIRSFADSINMKHPQIIKVLKGDRNYTMDTLLEILNALDLKISIEKR